ncbi:MAG TPA: GGDEF domain-containing protein, partial [Epsilonproteobacteria bacterium]|nr:GGDEF domain-containing protein [Campylobacterota bacterium]
RNGQSYIQWLSITTVKDSDDEIENYIAIFSDVTHHRKDTQAKLHHATHDPLTGLSNRLLLNDRLHHAIDHAKRFEKHIGLIFCDLDNFKPINDTYGHTIGDEILKRVSHSLRSILRSEDTICRFGGDEFVILVEDLKDFDFMHDILTRINQLTTTPCVIDNHTIQMGMSIGAAIYPDDGLTSDQLIKAADTAMYRAKRGGKNRVKYAQEDINIYALKQKTDPNAFSYVI